MYFGYNTNGLAHHALGDAVELLAEIGYDGVAITLDHDLLERCDGNFFWRTPLGEIRDMVVEHAKLRSVIETGARFLLDPWRKHKPNLLDPNPEMRRLRQRYYFRAVELAETLGSDCVSIWSGAANSETEPENEAILFARLSVELRTLVDFAGERGVQVAFEPEPGMMIDTMAQFERLLDSAPPELGLTLDVGHLFCQNESIPFYVQRHAERLLNVHFDDAVRGVHEHLLPGDGQISFSEFFTALCDVSYTGGVYAELSRHSHQGVVVAQNTLVTLSSAVPVKP